MIKHADLQTKIHDIYEKKVSIAEPSSKEAIVACIDLLDRGQIRVASKEDGACRTHSWIKEAILLYFQIMPMQKMEAGVLSFFDKIPLKNWNGEDEVRVVPHAVVRKGAFVNKGVICMPSYINIGAYVDSGTMVDTWATVGSCVQIGKNVHLSGGVGVGGVLEPLQASPVIIEDDAFIGSRCILVEGALIEEGAVLGAGVTITGTTRVIDVTREDEVVYRGRVPKYSVVIPGNSIKEFPSGDYAIPSALIIGTRDEKTDRKVSLNAVLREI